MLSIGSVGTSAIMRTIQEAIALTDGMVCRVICSRDLQRAEEFARSVGVEGAVGSYDDLLRRDDLDLIYLASPNHMHFSQALAALERGKHVIAEKPLVTTRREAEALFDAARASGVFLLEAITTLFMPNYLRCRELLPQLGPVRRAELTYAQHSSKYDAYLRGENPNIFNPAMQAGALCDMGVYGVHMAVSLFGAPEAVRYDARRGPNGIDLSGTLTLSYGEFDCTVLAAKDQDLGSGCRVEGLKGWFSETGPLNDYGTCAGAVDGEAAEFPAAQAANRMVYEMARFRRAIDECDQAFFEAMARQSILVADILERARPFAAD